MRLQSWNRGGWDRGIEGGMERRWGRRGGGQQQSPTLPWKLVYASLMHLVDPIRDWLCLCLHRNMHVCPNMVCAHTHTSSCHHMSVCLHAKTRRHMQRVVAEHKQIIGKWRTKDTQCSLPYRPLNYRNPSARPPQLPPSSSPWPSDNSGEITSHPGLSLVPAFMPTNAFIFSLKNYEWRREFQPFSKFHLASTSFMNEVISLVMPVSEKNGHVNPIMLIFMVFFNFYSESGTS